MDSLPRNGIRHGGPPIRPGGALAVGRKTLATAAVDVRQFDHRHRRQPRLHQPARFPSRPRSTRKGRHV